MGKKDPSLRFTNRASDAEINRRYEKKGTRPRVDKDREKELDKLLPALYSKIPEEPVDFQQFPTEAKLWARAAWWSGKYSVPEIAEAINTPDITVYKWIRGNSIRPGWADDKEKADKRALVGAVRSNTVRMDKLMTKMLTVLETTIRRVIEENSQLTVDEFGKITNAFEKIFKIRQLELGRPTEIFAGEDGQMPTWMEIRKKLEEVDYVEVEMVKDIGSN